MVYPRSAAHWTSMLAVYDTSYFAAVPGVHKPTSGGSGLYNTCIMRDPIAYKTGCKDWKVPDNGRWWLRDTIYTEPNGDYTSNAFLGFHGFDGNNTVYNDGSSTYYTSKYICSLNDKP